jgi:hypothetical protein
MLLWLESSRCDVSRSKVRSCRNWTLGRDWKVPARRKLHAILNKFPSRDRCGCRSNCKGPSISGCRREVFSLRYVIHVSDPNQGSARVPLPSTTPLRSIKPVTQTCLWKWRILSHELVATTIVPAVATHGLLVCVPFVRSLTTRRTLTVPQRGLPNLDRDR